MKNRMIFLACLCLSVITTIGVLFVMTIGTQAAPNITITVDTIDDEINSDGDCSLREAIVAANTDAAVDACPAGSGADTIVLPAGTYTLTIPGMDENAAATGDLDITESVVIYGAGVMSSTIDGNALDRVLHINPGQFAGVEVTLSGVTIQNGNSTQGGGIYNDAAGTLTVTNSTISDNYVDEDGGGIFNYSSFSSLTLINSTLFNNTTSGFSMIEGGGAGLYNNGNSFITATTFLSNTSSGNNGGGIWNNGQLTIYNSSFFTNTAGSGGGLYVNFPGSLTLSNNDLSNNQAFSGTGGGISINGGNSDRYTLTNNTITNNSVIGNGGGVACYGTSIEIINSMILSNTADYQGGGIWISTLETTTITHSTISGNISNADMNGGGGGISNEGNLFVIRSTIADNETTDKGGGIYHVNGELYIENTTISQNVAEEEGGGVHTGAFPGTVLESTIAHNVVSGLQASGGGIYNHSNLVIRNSAIYSNTSTGFLATGGGIYHDVFGANLDLDNTTIFGNAVDGSGGGLALAGGTASLNNVTINGNISDQIVSGNGDGGGLYREDGTITIQNSIIAGNHDLSSGTVHPDCSSPAGGIVSNGYNLVGIVDGCNWTSTTGDLTGSLSAPLDPLLGPLADNGGPTLTHALLAGSPALNAANPDFPGSNETACETIDQRGRSRFFQGPACDIGAYEWDEYLHLYMPAVVRGLSAR